MNRRIAVSVAAGVVGLVVGTAASKLIFNDPNWWSILLLAVGGGIVVYLVIPKQ